jgi:hypothetical protein
VRARAKVSFVHAGFSRSAFWGLGLRFTSCHCEVGEFPFFKATLIVLQKFGVGRGERISDQRLLSRQRLAGSIRMRARERDIEIRIYRPRFDRLLPPRT